MSEDRLETALLLDRKFWQEKKKGIAGRPLRKWHRGDLVREGIHEIVRRALGLRTRGEALAEVGRELRIRTRESGNG